MAYFSFKKIGTLVILPMIVLASITAEAYSAPSLRVQKQKQAQTQRRQRVFTQKQFTLNDPPVTECLDEPILVKSKFTYNTGESATS